MCIRIPYFRRLPRRLRTAGCAEGQNVQTQAALSCRKQKDACDKVVHDSGEQVRRKGGALEHAALHARVASKSRLLFARQREYPGTVATAAELPEKVRCP